jgi:hypothetical protein
MKKKMMMRDSIISYCSLLKKCREGTNNYLVEQLRSAF